MKKKEKSFMSGELKTTENSCKKAFELFHEDVFRMLRQRYFKDRRGLTWLQFQHEFDEKVKQDALRLRSLNR